MTNTWYWPEKIGRNKQRDLDTDERLRAAGWHSLRVWEHENPEEAARKVRAVVESVKTGGSEAAWAFGDSETKKAT